MAEFGGSDPESLRGKVVLINFWTYTCINWRRQLPYVRALHQKYKDQGLVVIGVHAPEFEFEKDRANVRWAVNDMKINYPVAVDNNHTIWRAFRNQAWPALYFIDAQGRIRHHFLGEGAYEQSEMIVQALLREAGAIDVSREPVVVDARGHDATPDWGNLKSPENYVGFQDFAGRWIDAHSRCTERFGFGRRLRFEHAARATRLSVSPGSVTSSRLRATVRLQ